jgi:hypothetical protein
LKNLTNLIKKLFIFRRKQMNKKKIMLLGAILAMSATSMASVIPLEDTKGDMVVQGRVTDRLGRERTEVEFNSIWLNDRNKLDIEWERNDYEVGTDGSFAQFELYTQLGDSGRFELYTDFKAYNNAGTDSTTGYVDVMPAFIIARSENVSSLVRLGVGFDQGHTQNGVNQTRVVGEFKNNWTVNDWLGLEANAYAWNMNDTGYNKVALEAYWHTNHELKKFDNGVTITFLTEGGFDPYTFADREYTKLEDGKDVGTGDYDSSMDEDYYFYFQPTVKINVPISDGKYNVYIEPGYYMDWTGGTAVSSSSDEDDDGMFMRVGFSTKF